MHGSIIEKDVTSLTFIVSTAVTRSTASNKMKMSHDKISQSIGDKLEPTNTERLVRLGLQNIDNKKEETMKRRAKTLEQQNNRRALTTMLSSKHKRSWLCSQRGLTPRNTICLIQALSGTLPNKVNKTRGVPNIELKSAVDATTIKSKMMCIYYQHAK